MDLSLVVHIVRRFGPVGGMEKYVFDLTHELVNLGINVLVVCEEISHHYDPKINIKRVKIPACLHRWQSMLAFREVVSEFCEQFLGQCDVIIHSHERSICHHVTTFHGPPLKQKSFLDGLGLNRRYNAWAEMELSEVTAPAVKKILCVSSLVKFQLAEKYPSLVDASYEIAWPGYPGKPVRGSELTPFRTRSSRPLKALFVGREWKRKGLALAHQVVKEFRRKYFDCSLDIFGPDSSELPRRLIIDGDVIIHGWRSAIPWHEFDVLLHPAHNEPFGMVVPEARINGVPALISTATGSLALNFEGVEACGVDEPISTWLQSLYYLIKKPNAYTAETRWTWQQLAKLHLHDIYPAIKLSNLSPTVKLK